MNDTENEQKCFADKKDHKINLPSSNVYVVTHLRPSVLLQSVQLFAHSIEGH